MRFRAALSAAEILRHCSLNAGDLAGNESRPGIPDLAQIFIDSLDDPESSRVLDQGQVQVHAQGFGDNIGIATESISIKSIGSLTFLGATASKKIRANLKAALILAEPGIALPEGIPAITIPSIHIAISNLVTALKDCFVYPTPFTFVDHSILNSNHSNSTTSSATLPNQISPHAMVEGNLEGGVFVGAGAYIAKGAYIGMGSRIEANATVLENCRIGKNCIVQSGAVIGSAGFGFFPDENGLQVMPHLAGVEIGDGCWIGANTVIAAGVLNPTRLGRACKLDSHVQIAHNVVLGEEALLASQSGIAGSTKIGDRFQMGGAASVDGHLHIGDDVSVAACSGVTKDFPSRSVVAGFPACPIQEWRREKVLIRRLDPRN